MYAYNKQSNWSFVFEFVYFMSELDALFAASKLISLYETFYRKSLLRWMTVQRYYTDYIISSLGKKNS